MKEFIKYAGLDTHKDTIAVAVSDAQGGKVHYFGEISNIPEAVRKRVKQLSPDGERTSFWYEAGPCAYDVYRLMTVATINPALSLVKMTVISNTK